MHAHRGRLFCFSPIQEEEEEEESRKEDGVIKTASNEQAQSSTQPAMKKLKGKYTSRYSLVTVLTIE